MSLLVITYLFLGGLGAGALLVMLMLDFLSPQASLAYAQGAEPISARHRNATSLPQKGRYIAQVPYQSFFLPGYLVSGTTLALGALCLAFDLGRPDRLFNLFFNPTFSYITLGTFALTLALVLSIVFAVVWAGSGTKRGWPRWLVRSLEVLGVASALAVILYTGLLLVSIGTGTFLDSFFIPLVFTVSALSCGIALVVATSTLTGATNVFAASMKRLVKIDSVLLIAELVVIAAFMLCALFFGHAQSQQAVQSLLWGSQAVVFWTGLVIVGLILPFVLENIPRLTLASSGLVVASTVLIGGFILRWCFIEVGLPTVIVGA